jgi:hypothetical protein
MLSITLFFLDSKVAIGENGSEQRTRGTKWSRDAKLFYNVICGPSKESELQQKIWSLN